jgi:hypothetical protein
MPGEYGWNGRPARQEIPELYDWTLIRGIKVVPE